MAYYTINLSANKAVTMQVAGRVILVDDLGGAPGVDIMPNYGGRDLPNMPNRKKAFKFSEPFDSVTLKTTIDATIGIFLSKNDVSLGFADGASVNVTGQVVVSNTGAARVPVDVAGGTVTVTATNVGNQPLNTIVDLGNVEVGGDAVSVSNDTTLRRLRFRNVSTGGQTIALGGPGVEMDSPIVLAPGESYFEEDAAGAHWYALADGAGAIISRQGLKA